MTNTDTSHFTVISEALLAIEVKLHMVAWPWMQRADWLSHNYDVVTNIMVDCYDYNINMLGVIYFTCVGSILFVESGVVTYISRISTNFILSAVSARMSQWKIWAALRRLTAAVFLTFKSYQVQTLWPLQLHSKILLISFVATLSGGSTLDYRICTLRKEQ